MRTTDPRTLPVPIPAPRRVGAQVGTLMLVESGSDAQAMMETLRGGSLSCAAFCEQLLELGAGRRQGSGERPSA